MATSEEDESQYNSFCRAAVLYLDKFERYECQELLSYSAAHWLLSSEMVRMQAEPLQGMVSTVSPKEDTAVILFPVDSEVSPLCYREIHQIVRELTMGVYVFNQTPVISLVANYDQSTVCNMPPAYLDTRVGQLLTNVDYMMKSLWHGAHIPRDKRIKFAERWREIFDVNSNGQPDTRKSLYSDFQFAGLIDITRDRAFADVYSELPQDIPDDKETEEERCFFNNNVDNMAMQLTFYQDEVEYYKNIYVVNSEYHVSSIVHLLDTQIEKNGFERLKMRLQMHEMIIQKYLAAKQETRRQLELLKVISYLVPFLLGMRKRMKIPDIKKLLPALNSEDCITEREFPPLFLGPDFQCKNFKFADQYFHLHGGISFDLETKSMVQSTEPFVSVYQDIEQLAVKELYKHLKLDQPIKDYYNIPVCTVNGKSYYAFVIEFETFYGSSPHRPLWVRAFQEEIEKLRPKRLPITDIHILEQLKKYFGVKKAIKYKTPGIGIKFCARRGMVSIFNVLARKVTGARIIKQDEQGLSLIHHAAMYNQPQIICRLLMNGMDINVRRNNFMATEYKRALAVLVPTSSSHSSQFKLRSASSPRYSKISIPKQVDGLTALHVAARCGALDAASCLISNHANILALDQDGWTPIHYAAFFDHYLIVRLMVQTNPDLLDLPTKSVLHSTPLLLAASSGALSVVKCLIALEAEIGMTDSEGNGLVTLAALRFHTNILHYLAGIDHPDISVWKILAEMLSDINMDKKDSAVKCLEILSTAEPDNWMHILNAGAVPALIRLLEDNKDMQSVTAAVLCNISENEPVKLALTEAEAVPVLIKLLSSPLDEVQSRAAIIIADITLVGENQKMIAACRGIEPLVSLFKSQLEDVLVNVVNAVRILCLGNHDNQDVVAKYGGLEHLVEFLELPSVDLQAGAAAALSSVISRNTANQNHAISINAHKPLVDLIKNSRSVTVQVKAANALEAIATNNFESQKCFLELDAPKALQLLLKNVHVEVREQGACSLWSLAGNTRTQQKYIAERVTVPHIIQMLLEPTEKLLYVGCMMAIALGTENIPNQNKLAATEAFSQLMRLLRSPKTSQKVLHMVVKVLGILCLGIAFKNNKVTQLKIAEEGGISALTNLLIHPPSEEIEVEVAISLACVTLCCKENQEMLTQEHDFSYDILLNLLRHKQPEILLRAGMALTIFAFNSTSQQYAIREAGGVKYNLFKKFIESSDEFYQCYGAFQIVVLCRVIINKDHVWLTAQGIELLVSKLNSEDKVVMLACSLLSSLAHTRAGLSDAMVSVGVLDLLVKKLKSENEMVRNATAITLGYLTFNRTAYRLLFSICRNMPGLYQKIMENIGEDPHFNQDFTRDFKRATAIGLPSQCLEINGGLPVKSPKSASKTKKRPVTSDLQKKYDFSSNSRADSAPSKLWSQGGKLSIPNIEKPDCHKVKQRNSASSYSYRPLSTLTSLSGKTDSVKLNLDSWR